MHVFEMGDSCNSAFLVIPFDAQQLVFLSILVSKKGWLRAVSIQGLWNNWQQLNLLYFGSIFFVCWVCFGLLTPMQ